MGGSAGDLPLGYRHEGRFLIHHDADDTVRTTIRAFSRPARWYTKLGAPLARHVQDRSTTRYLDALAATT